MCSHDSPERKKGLNQFMDISERKFIVYGLLVICLFLLFLDVMNVIIVGERTAAYFWGLLIGALISLGYCLLISEKWDPENLRMNASDGSSTKTGWIWFVPLGVFAANILFSFFSATIADLIIGVAAGWLYTFFGYVALEVWRRRPK